MWLFLYLDAPSSPGMVRLSAIKSRSLEITWSRPHDGNSPILNYIIEYSNLPGKLQISMPLDGSTRVHRGAVRISIDGFQNTLAYQMIVQMCAGWKFFKS